MSVSELRRQGSGPQVQSAFLPGSHTHHLTPQLLSVENKSTNERTDKKQFQSQNFFAQSFSEMRQQIQVPPYWNNEIDHLSKSSHLMEAKRAIDTSLLSPRNRTLKGKGLK